MKHHLHKVLITVTLLVTGLIVVACGGGGGGGLFAGGGIGGTGVTSGTVSGFGSVFVNGIEFETDGASRTVNDVTDISNGRDDDKVLGIGMVVTIVGTINDDGVTGTAESIRYDNEIEGPVAATPVQSPDGLSKTFDIFNVTVVIDRDTSTYEKTDFASIAQDNVLEVSGYFDAAGRLLATRVEKKGDLVLGDSKVEVKGTVSGFDGVDTFVLGGLTVTFSGTTEFKGLPGTVKNGQFVEVKGILVTNASITATRIELDDGGFDDNIDKASIEGVVTDFKSLGNFRVSGQRVDASSAGFDPAALKTSIADGARVEVEGSIVNGILRARDIEQRDGDVRISALVSSKNASAGTVRLQVIPGQPLITVQTNNQTQIEDKLNDESPFGVSQIDAGDFLNVEGFVDGSGNFIATQIERDEPADIELRGPVDVPPTEGSTSSGTVSILGISITTTAATEFEDGSGSNFFQDVRDGDLVEFIDANEDGDIADGLADKVGFGD